MPKRPWWNIPQLAKEQTPKSASQKSPRQDVTIAAPSASGGGTSSVK